MSDVDAIDRALRPAVEAADVLARSAAQVAGEVRGQDEPPTTISAARSAVARLRGQAEDLLARLDNTDARLSELEEAALSARNFDTATWPARRDAIAARLAADPAGGAADWLAAWARAFLLGCPAEAPLATEPFALPPEALWCPDRLAVATDALTARSGQRLAPLLRYLAEGAPLAGRPFRRTSGCGHRPCGPGCSCGRASRSQRPNWSGWPARPPGSRRRRCWRPGRRWRGSGHRAPARPCGPDSAALAQAAWKAERCPAAPSRCSTWRNSVPGSRGARWTPRVP